MTLFTCYSFRWRASKSGAVHSWRRVKFLTSRYLCENLLEPNQRLSFNQDLWGHLSIFQAPHFFHIEQQFEQAEFVPIKTSIQYESPHSHLRQILKKIYM